MSRAPRWAESLQAISAPPTAAFEQLEANDLRELRALALDNARAGGPVTALLPMRAHARVCARAVADGCRLPWKGHQAE